MDLGHLYFDTPQRTPGRIVSTARCPAEDLELRISDFNLPDNSLPNMMIQSTTNNHLSFISNHCALRIFTLVESALQIRPFMQNKANFQKSQMNVNKVLTKDYEKRTLGERGKNKPNSNPIKANTKPIKANLLDAQMNVSSILTKDYENVRLCRRGKNKAKTNPIKPNFKGKKMLPEPNLLTSAEPGLHQRI